MKNKIILIITVLLLIIAAFLLFNEKKSTLNKKYADFAVEDTASITKIFLADKSNNQVVLKRIGGHWTVNDKFVAREDLIRILLRTIKTIEVQSPVAKSAHNTVISRLASNSVKCEIYQHTYRIDLFNYIKLFPHEKLVKTYFVGGSTQDQSGTYMLLDKAPEPYVTEIPTLRGFLTPRYNTQEIEWRERIIARYNPNSIASVAVTYYEKPENSFEIKYDGKGNFKLFGGQNHSIIQSFDVNKCKKYFTGLQKISIEAYATQYTKNQIDSIKNTGTICNVTITDNTRKICKISIYNKAPKEHAMDLMGKPLTRDLDHNFAFINDNKDFVLIQSYEFDRILKTPEYFIQTVGYK